jgi:hypothetical protein
MPRNHRIAQRGALSSPTTTLSTSSVRGQLALARVGAAAMCGERACLVGPPSSRQTNLALPKHREQIVIAGQRPSNGPKVAR